MDTINKEKISQMLEKKIGFPFSVSKDLVSTTFESAMEILLKQKSLKIKNFGSFSVKHKSARPGLNLKTGEMLQISEREVIRFIPSRNLKKELSSND